METLNGSVFISIPLFLRCRLCGFTTVLLFICVQTSYELAFPMYGGGGRIRTHGPDQSWHNRFQVCALMSTCALLHISQIVGLNYLSISGDSTSLSIFDYVKQRFSYSAQSHMAPLKTATMMLFAASERYI